MTLAHFAPALYTPTGSTEDPRLADLIQPYSDRALEQADVVLFGVPTDEGIARNGGRIGASRAPEKIREQLGRLTSFGTGFGFHKLKIIDLGDVRTGPLEEMHQVAEEATAELTRMGKVVIAMGGGHDVTYPLVKGHARYRKNLGLVNVDAHLDVRSLKNGLHHSGSSFRLLLDEGVVKPDAFIEFGIQPFVVAESHIRWLRQRRSEIIFHDEIQANGLQESLTLVLSKSAETYVSFDIDAIRSAEAPGVSAPSPVGFSANDAVWMARAAGRRRGVRMTDFVEMNPEYDIDSRTARLVARMISYFLLGVAER